jgi:glycolate oxidase
MSSAALKEIVGEGNVLDARIDQIVYASDASMREGKARMIVFPTELEQVQKIVRYADRTNANLTIRGGGTSLAGGAVPNDSIVMDLSKLNKILEINRKEKYAVVQAGVILDDLNYELGDELSFPIRPSSHSVATIGGMIATNAAGNNAIRYGRVMEWVSQLTVVDGTGKVFDMKGDDIKRFCGKEGTTGIIVEAKLKLTDKLVTKSMEHLKFDNIESMIEAVKKHRDNKNVSSIEFFNRFSAELSGIDSQNHLIIGFESDEGSIKEPKDIAALWEMREGLGPNMSSAGFNVMEDPRLPDGALVEFLNWVDKKEVPCFGHIGIGIFHPRFRKTQEGMIKDMFAFVKKIGGSVSGEHGIGIAKKEYVEKEFADEIKALKKEYDPDNVLNKGKII